MSEGRPCIFGEVLFDHFPDGQRVLGGAPFNVAWHLQAFGQAPRFISRVGDDDEGTTIRAAMRDWGMDTDGLQTDDRLPTGRVSVTLDNGEPSYDIVRPCAYDAIAAADCRGATLLYHGSLAVRADASRRTLRELVAEGPRSIFLDVNLRRPWWTSDDILSLLDQANWVKLNADELALLAAGSAAPRAFIERHGLDGLILTRGAEGADVIMADGGHWHAAPSAATHVVDTVGAGDAFASVMIVGLLRAWPPDATLQRAQAFASRIVGQRGATVSDPAFYQHFIDDWALNT